MTTALNYTIGVKAKQRDLTQLRDGMAASLVAGYEKARKAQRRLIDDAYRAPMAARVFREHAAKFQKMLGTSVAQTLSTMATAGTKAAKDQFDKQWKNMSKVWKEQREQIKKNASRQMEAAKAVAAFRRKELDERVSAYGTGMAGAITGALGALKGADLKGLADMVKGGGKGMRTGGRALDAKGAQMGGMKGVPVQGLGKMLAGLGTAVATIGAVVGSIALLVKVVLDAEAAVKDTNKAILDMGGAASISAGNIADIKKEMKTVGDFFTSIDFSMDWFTTPKQLQSIAKGFGEAGVSMRKLSGEVETARGRMLGLKNASELALTYANLFGMEAGEIAKGMGTIQFETGTTLGRIAEGFSQVNDMAKLSGFEVKRFYSAVLESTTGMGMYNHRIEEAAGLLSTLSTILGQTVGGDFLKGIKGGMEEKGLADRHKFMALAGKGNVMKVFADEQERNAKALLKDIEQMLGGTVDEQSQANAILSSLGLGHQDRAKLPETIMKMSGDAMGEAMASAMMGGATGEQTNRMFEIGGQGQAARGKAAAAEKFAGTLSPAAILQLELLMAKKRLGSGEIDEYGLGELMGAETLGAVPQAQRDEMMKMAQLLDGIWSKVKKGDELGGGEKEMLEKKFGVDVKGKKFFKAGTDEEVGDWIGLMGTMGQSLDAETEMVEQVSEDVALAREIAQETHSITNVLETTLASILREIWYTTEGTWSTLKSLYHGFLKKWGWDKVNTALDPEESRQMALTQLQNRTQRGRSAMGDIKAQMEGETDEGRLKELSDALDEVSRVVESEEAAAQAIRQDSTWKGSDPNALLLKHSTDVADASFGDTGKRQVQWAIDQATKKYDHQGLQQRGGLMDVAFGGGQIQGDKATIAQSNLMDPIISRLRSEGVEGAEEKGAKITRIALARAKKAHAGADLTESSSADAFAATVSDIMGEEYRRVMLEETGTTSLDKKTLDSMLEGLGVAKQKKAAVEAATDPQAIDATAEGVKKGLKSAELEEAYAAAKKAGIDMSGMAAEGSGDTSLSALLANAEEMGLTGDDLAAGLRDAVTHKVDDFILTNDGKLIQTNPLDTLTGSKGGAPGGGGNVQIVINGGDSQRIYAVVKKAMLAAGM